MVNEPGNTIGLAKQTVERMKKWCYSRIFANDYFWRTYDQQEIDLVEEREGRLWG